MRVLVIGEGATELGRAARDRSPAIEGALLVIVRRLIGEVAANMPVEFVAKELKQLPRRSAEGSRRMGPSAVGFANKLQALLALPLGREADAIIMVVDREGPRNKERIQELNAGRDALRAANKPCAVGVDIEMIEA